MDKAPLTEHLGELRNRLLLSLIAVAIAFGACFYYSEVIFRLLTSPLNYTLKFSLENPFISFIPSEEEGIKLVFLAPAEALWMHIKIAFMSAFIICSPLVFYETWKFIAPGLLEKERKYALPFVFTTTFLFLIGALFCFIIVLPLVTPEFLAKNRKYAVLIAFIAAALLTPTPDAFNQSLMAIPIIILYEVGILASRILDRKKKKKEKE